jgi:hypothetical protein
VEIRTQILTYVLALSTSAEDYVKGQEEDTEGQAYRTGVLGTCKALYVEASMALFNTNHFIINGLVPLDRNSRNTEENVLIRFRLFVDKRSEPVPNSPTWFTDINSRDLVSNAHGFSLDQVQDKNVRRLDHTRIPSDLQSRIKFLAVAVDVAPVAPIDTEFSRYQKSKDSFTPAKPFWEYISDVSQFLHQCKCLRSLNLSLNNWRCFPDIKSVYIKVLRQLSRPIDVKEVNLFSMISFPGPRFPGKNSFTREDYILSEGFHNHIKNSLRMKKGSLIPVFSGDQFFRRVFHLSASLTEEQLAGIIEDDENLVLTKSGWDWK